MLYVSPALSFLSAFPEDIFHREEIYLSYRAQKIQPACVKKNNISDYLKLSIPAQGRDCSIGTP